MPLLGWKFFLNRVRVSFMAKLRKKEREKKNRMDLYYRVAKYLARFPDDKEKTAILQFFQSNGFQTFPYNFVKKYDSWQPQLLYDDVHQCYYTEWHGKTMYLKKSFTRARAIEYMRSIMIEQDKHSPHHYSYKLPELKDKVLADMGGAEGFFSLDLIDQVSKIYIFECNPEWLEALKLTFKPWGDKVEIVDKYIDEKDDAQSVTLDTFFKNKKVDFIKADIEGYEVPMLRGGTQTLPRVSQLILCVYHKQTAEKEMRDILQNFGFNVRVSKGFMFFDMYDEMQEPYLRRSLLYANK